MNITNSILKLHQSITGGDNGKEKCNNVVKEANETKFWNEKSSNSESEYESISDDVNNKYIDVTNDSLIKVSFHPYHQTNYQNMLKKMRIIEHNKDMLENRFNKLLKEHHVYNMTYEYYEKMCSDLPEKDGEFYWCLEQSSDAYDNMSDIVYFDMKELNDKIDDSNQELYEIETDIINAGYPMP